MIRLFRTAERSPDRVVADLARPHAAADPDAVLRVAAIVDEVRRRGDAAVIDFTKRFDGVELRPEELRISEAEWAAASVASGLSVEDCVKRSSLIHYTPAGLRAAWPHLAALAAAEGLHGHGEAARIRLESPRTGGHQ